MNIVLGLTRDLSAAEYVWKRREELPLEEGGDALLAAIETGVALERAEAHRARASWREVTRVVERAGRSAFRNGVGPQRLMKRIDHVRDAVELVLFDGWLPPDIAARASRGLSRMCARIVQRALRAYWEERSGSPTCSEPSPR